MFQMRPDIADAIGNSFHQNYYNDVDPPTFFGACDGEMDGPCSGDGMVELIGSKVGNFGSSLLLSKWSPQKSL